MSKTKIYNSADGVDVSYLTLEPNKNCHITTHYYDLLAIENPYITGRPLYDNFSGKVAGIICVSDSMYDSIKNNNMLLAIHGQDLDYNKHKDSLIFARAMGTITINSPLESGSPVEVLEYVVLHKQGSGTGFYVMGKSELATLGYRRAEDGEVTLETITETKEVEFQLQNFIDIIMESPAHVEYDPEKYYSLYISLDCPNPLFEEPKLCLQPPLIDYTYNNEDLESFGIVANVVSDINGNIRVNVSFGSLFWSLYKDEFLTVDADKVYGWVPEDVRSSINDVIGPSNQVTNYGGISIDLVFNSFIIDNRGVTSDIAKDVSIIGTTKELTAEQVELVTPIILDMYTRWKQLVSNKVNFGDLKFKMTIRAIKENLIIQ